MLSKKRLFLLFAGLIAAVAGLAYGFYIPSAPLFSDRDSYATLWKRVDSCERKGLTESAMKVVNEIYRRSKTEKNAPQLVKSVIYRMKFDQYKEEASVAKSIHELEEELKTAEYPARPVLQSLLANAYWSYYESNRWQFQQRSQTVSFDKADVATWDVKSIVYAAMDAHLASLRDPAALKATKVEVFDEVIDRGSSNTRAWRPTLYDFIAHRALDFFKNSEADVTMAGNQFTLNDPEYLRPFQEFLKFAIPKAQDSLDLKYHAVKLFQDLENFHNGRNDEALVDLEMERLEFFFSNSVNESKDSLYLGSLKWLKQRFPASKRVAELKHLEATWWLRDAGKYQPLEGEVFKWNRKKAVEICTAIVKDHPGSRGAQLAKNTLLSLQQKDLHLTTETVNDNTAPNRVLLKSTNLKKVYLRLVKTDYFDWHELTRKHYGKDLISKALNLSLVHSSEQALTDDGDYNMHSCEVMVPAAANGYYVLLASDNPQFSVKTGKVTYQLYVVSGMSYLFKRQPEGSYEYYVLDRQTGQPLKDVSAQLWYTAYNYKSNRTEYQKGKLYTTDDKGYFKATAEGNNNFFVEFRKENDQLFSNDGFYTYREHEPAGVQQRSFIFTDRAIYRPGQTVYFKSILMEGKDDKYEVLSGRRMTVAFYDVNSQLISSQELSTNEYGTVSGSFTAPQGVLTGQMRIVNDYATTYVSVEEYKRPKFEAVFDTLKGSYTLNEEVSIKGFAKAYAGNAIDGAKVNYRVVRQVRYPGWWYWYRSYTPGAETEIANGQVVSDVNGVFEIRFVAKPDPAVSKTDDPVYTYAISADVTDVNGETHSAQQSFRAGYKALELEFSLPEVLDLSDLPPLMPVARNLNGVEEMVSGTVTVSELTQPDRIFRKRLWEQPDRQVFSRDEYYRLFPQDQYEDEVNPRKWTRKAIAFSKTFDTKKPNENLNEAFKKLKPGVYVVESVCKDKNGQDVKALSNVTVYDPVSGLLPKRGPLFSYFKETSVEPGKTAELVVASSYPDVYSILDVESKAGEKRSFVSPSLKPIEVIVNEGDRGGIVMTSQFVKYGRYYSVQRQVSVPYSNKDLSIEYASFRNKLLPGQKEEWKLIVKNNKGDAANAELLATLYDASLDAFRPNFWGMGLYSNFSPRWYWSHSLEDRSESQVIWDYRDPYIGVDAIDYDQLNYFGLYFYGGMMYDRLAEVEVTKASHPLKKMRARMSRAKGEVNDAAARYEMADQVSYSADGMEVMSAPAEKAFSPGGGGGKELKQEEQAPPTPRSNFNETAFFFPELRTNEKGEVLVQFTIPESLTRWKFMGLAHSKDLSVGQTQQEVVTQKELMVVPNAPRFFRENDRMFFVSKISNLSDKDLSGTAEIRFFDAFTEKDITAQLTVSAEGNKTFSLKKGLSSTVQWELNIPEGFQAIKYRVVAKAGNFSDGEEMAVPVLSNRMLVTESLPLPVRGGQTKNFSFDRFIGQNNKSTTLRNHAYTLEFTANPAWYAVQSLPYLMEYPYECAEQTSARYYSNALASHIVNSKPKIWQIFEAWKSTSPESFLSNLEKNQELKALVLEETPWVLQAKNESENKKRVALLFDLNRMSNELNSALTKLEQMQTINGGWPWFQGCPEDWYISQHIICNFGHLQNLGVIDPQKAPRVFAMIDKALPFCDRKLKEHYDQIRKYNKNYQTENHLDYMAIHYLYMRSYFKNKEVASSAKEAVSYFKKQAAKYWLSNGRYLQGMIALALHRDGDQKTPKDILASLKENALNSEEMGMYWKENYGGYYWYQAPIEAQALMVEAFDEVAKDTRAVDDLRTWLIKSKQTQNWSSTKATTEAVYALLLRGTDWLSTEPDVEITVGDQKLDPKNDASLKAEAGTGYFKKTWRDGDIKPAMGKITVAKRDAGVSWGAVYWQYFEQLDKITPQETPLKLSKKLFVESNTTSGPVITPVTAASSLKIGNKVRVRIELRVDRDMEYVHLKDMRAAGFEPVNVFSGYRYQDGLYYYESTRDAATNFFISRLPKGTYVFEYTVLVSHAGDFSNGISSIQCMYAPEFTSHSEGVRVQVSK